MLLNNSGFKFIRTQRYDIVNPPPNSFEDRPGTLIWLLRTWDDRDYYYCEIFQGNAFDIYPIDTIVPEDILEKLRNDNNTCLYIANTHEAFLDIVEPLYRSLVIEANIPPRKIYIANEAADLCNEMRKFCDKYNYEYFNIEWLLEFEFSISIQANQCDLDGKTILTDKKYDKKFLNFNRRWRLHRPTLVALLHCKGLLDKGYVSMAPSDDGRDWSKMVPWMISHNEHDNELHTLLKSHEQELLNLPPLYLDTDELVNNRAVFEKQSLYLYENSLVSVVNETNFYTHYHPESARFLSEKIFKPIAVGHPFIIVSVPKTLELLKSLGYKSFHPYIDESYDNEFNDFERMKKILKEIEKISNMTDDQVKEFIKNVKPIAEHNQQLIKNKTIPFMKGQDPNCQILHSHFVRKTL